MPVQEDKSGQKDAASEDKKQSKAEFRESQRVEAENQNQTAENAVPERRPQASQQLGEQPHSDLTQKLIDADDPSVAGNEPHDQAAYDRADSDSQAKKAAEDSVTEGLMVGNVAIATKGPHEGRVFAIVRIVDRGSPADIIRNASGDPAQLYNTPKEVECRAIGDERDGELIVLNVEEVGLEKKNEAWRGSRAGRRH